MKAHESVIRTNRQALEGGGHGGSESGQLPVLQDEHSAEDLADGQLVGAGLSRRRNQKIQFSVPLREGPGPADGLPELLVSLVHLVHGPETSKTMLGLLGGPA